MGTLRTISDSSEPFRNRREAGRLLPGGPEELDGTKTPVPGIPRGGIVIAKEIAIDLEAQMDALFTHKLGAPANAELAIGSVSEDGFLFVNKQILSREKRAGAFSGTEPAHSDSHTADDTDDAGIAKGAEKR